MIEQKTVLAAREELNDVIKDLNVDGWKVEQFTEEKSAGGAFVGFLLLCTKPAHVHARPKDPYMIIGFDLG